MTRRQRWTLICTVIGSGAVFLDGTIVNAALKHIGQELPGSFIGVLEGQAYIVSGYLAVLAALLILSGRAVRPLRPAPGLRDRPRRVRRDVGPVRPGPDARVLVVFRLAQGAAGALLIPGSLALITHAFDGAARARAFGIWAASTSALVVLGPIVGGTLVDTIGWRFAFLINVPLARVRAVGDADATSQESRDTETTGRFDWLGALVAALAVGGLAFGVIRGQANAWADPAAWIALAIGVVCLVLFPILMARRPNPLVPLELFRSRAFATVNLATFFIYGALYVTFFYQAVILQGVLGYTALGGGHRRHPERDHAVAPVDPDRDPRRAAGLAAVPRRGPAADGPRAAVVRPAPGRFGALAGRPRRSRRRSSRRSTCSSTSCRSRSCSGSASRCVVAPLTSTLMGSISGRFSGLGSAINNSISRVGQPLLGALIFIVISATYYASLGSAAGLDTTDPAVRHAFQPLNPPAAGASPAAGRRLEPGLARRLPPGDAHLRGPARRRRGGVVVRPARASGSAGGQRITRRGGRTAGHRRLTRRSSGTAISLGRGRGTARRDPG